MINKNYLILLLLSGCYLDTLTTLTGLAIGLFETNLLWYLLGVPQLVALKVLMNSCIAISFYLTEHKVFQIIVGVILLSVGLHQLYYGIHNILMILAFV